MVCEALPHPRDPECQSYSPRACPTRGCQPPGHTSQTSEIRLTLARSYGSWPDGACRAKPAGSQLPRAALTRLCLRGPCGHTHADCAWLLRAQMPTAGMCFMFPRLFLACLGVGSCWASQLGRWVAAAGEQGCPQHVIAGHPSGNCLIPDAHLTLFAGLKA